MPSRPLIALSMLALALGASPGPAAPASTNADPGTTTVVYLVRHAEKEPDAGSDPALTAAGRGRANALAEILGDAGIDKILATDFRRTRDTAGPLARRLDLEVELYDPTELEALAADLKSREGGTVLVVGHSNTTPALVSLLDGDPGEPIAEDEYGRLYRVELPSGRTTMERFEVVTIP